MNKEKKESSNGITLVALVVTVIVLLILAGTTITTLLGENGIIKKAQQVADKMKEEAENEQQKINDLIDELDNIIHGETLEDLNLKLIIETSDDILEYNNEIFISPGSSYEIKLINEDTGEKINGQNVEWSCENAYINIDENGIITVSENSIFGSEVIIDAKYNGQEVELLCKTLQRISLGTDSNNSVIQLKYVTSSNPCELFTENSYSTNDKINTGILPGENGYTMIAMNGITEQQNYNMKNEKFNVMLLSNINNNYMVKKIASSKLNISLNPIGLDITSDSLSSAISCGSVETSAQINISICENDINIPGLSMNGYILKTSGSVFAEKEEFSYSEGIWEFPTIICDPNTDIGDIIVLEYSIPKWNELTETEIQSLLEIMNEGSSYLASLTISIAQID